MKTESATCVTAGELRSYLLGLATGEAEETVAEHLSACEACAAAADEVERTMEREDDGLVASLRQCAGELPELLDTCRETVGRIERLASTWGESLPDFQHEPEPPPKQVREYELLESLGEGGMGRVFLARHRKLDSLRAIKLLPARSMKDEQAVARFEQEMRAAGKVVHPHLVTAHDAGEENGVHFLVMEFVDGDDLGSLVCQHGPLPIGAACEIGRQVALALEHLHRHGLVHRDVKPSNVLVGRDGNAKLADFGLALLTPNAASEGAANAGDASPRHEPGEVRGRLTSYRQWLGTAGYVAPEQAVNSRGADIRADLYSLGATLRRALTGQPAGRLERAGDVDASVVESINRLLARMTAERPEDRFATPGELVRALEPWASPAELRGWLSSRLSAAESEATLSEVATRTKQRTGSIPRTSRWLLVAVVLLAVGVSAAVATSSSFVNRAAHRIRRALLPDNASNLGQARVPALQEDPSFAGARPETANQIPDWREIKVPAPQTPEPAASARQVSPWAPGEYVANAAGLIPRPAATSFASWQLETVAPATFALVLAWHPNGRWLACGGDDRTVRVFDVTAGRLAQMRPIALALSPWSFPTRVAYSHDGEWLAASGHDRAYVWCADDNKDRAAVDCVTAWPVARLAWSPAGARLALGLRDEFLVVRDYPSNRELRLAGHVGPVEALGWSREGQFVVTGSGEGVVRLWDVRTETSTSSVREKVLEFRPHQGPVMGVAWNPHDDRLATAGFDGIVHVWRVDTSTRPLAVQPHLLRDPRAGKVATGGQSLAWSPDGARLAAGCQKGVVPIWDAEGRLVTTLQGHDDSVEGVAWSPDGSELATSSLDGTIRRWRADGTQLAVVARSAGRRHAVAFSPQHELVVVSGWDGTLRTFTPSGQFVEARRTFARGAAHAAPLAWSADGTSLATAGRSTGGTSNISVLRPVADKPDTSPSLRAVYSFAVSSVAVHALSWHPTHPILAAANHEGRVCAWHGKTKLFEVETGTGGIGRLAWSPDGEHLAFVVDGESGVAVLRLWRVESTAASPPAMTATAVDWKTAPKATALAWTTITDPRETTRRTSRLVAALRDGTIRAWNVVPGAENLDTPRDPVVVLRTAALTGASCLSASPDGKWLAVSDAVCGLQLVSTAGDEPRTLRAGHYGPVTAMAWHPDGRRLFTVGFDNTVRATDTTTGECLWFSVCLPDGLCAEFSPAGELLRTNCNLESALVVRATSRATGRATGRPGQSSLLAPEPFRADAMK